MQVVLLPCLSVGGGVEKGLAEGEDTEVTRVGGGPGEVVVGVDWELRHLETEG